MTSIAKFFCIIKMRYVGLWNVFGVKMEGVLSLTTKVTDPTLLQLQELRKRLKLTSWHPRSATRAHATEEIQCSACVTGALLRGRCCSITWVFEVNFDPFFYFSCIELLQQCCWYIEKHLNIVLNLFICWLQKYLAWCAGTFETV